MDTESELTALRKEIAELRKEVKDLRRFITIQHDENTGEPCSISIRCCVLSFVHPDAPGRIQMLFTTHPDGPGIGIWDSHEKCRIFLGVENDDPQITLRTAEGKDAVLLRADPEDGRGLVAVLDNGNPRALMKAGPDNAGVVSVVHDDGMTRVCLRSTENDGTFMVASLDMQAAVKITSESFDGGGTLTVNGFNGKPAVILGSTERIGGTVIVNGPDGKPAASLPDAGFEKEDGEEG